MSDTQYSPRQFLVYFLFGVVVSLLAREFIGPMIRGEQGLYHLHDRHEQLELQKFGLTCESDQVQIEEIEKEQDGIRRQMTQHVQESGRETVPVNIRKFMNEYTSGQRDPHLCRSN